MQLYDLHRYIFAAFGTTIDAHQVYAEEICIGRCRCSFSELVFTVGCLGS